jgi:hypothetical protein
VLVRPNPANILQTHGVRSSRTRRHEHPSALVEIAANDVLWATTRYSPARPRDSSGSGSLGSNPSPAAHRNPRLGVGFFLYRDTRRSATVGPNVRSVSDSTSRLVPFRPTSAGSVRSAEKRTLPPDHRRHKMSDDKTGTCAQFVEALLHPQLVKQDAELGVVDVVADPLRHQIGPTEGVERNRRRLVHE